MLTRCPACATHFRVTPEQLKARSGRVRCGECQQVFNALDSLIEEPVLAMAPPQRPPLPVQDVAASPVDTGAAAVPEMIPGEIVLPPNAIAAVDTIEVPAAPLPATEESPVAGEEPALPGETTVSTDVPDPDLIIRTSGEKRLSNFWIWQSAYSELYFTDTLWPDFGRKELEEALSNYKDRERRYGSIGKN